jgi:hypothetical protein
MKAKQTMGQKSRAEERGKKDCKQRRGRELGKGAGWQEELLFAKEKRAGRHRPTCCRKAAMEPPKPYNTGPIFKIGKC